MVRLIGMILGGVVNIIVLPFALVLAIPTGIMKAKSNQKSRLLFTGVEQSLLGKAQRAINMSENGMLSPDRDLLVVAKCIEDSRIAYQTIKNRERYDATFSDFVGPRISECQVRDWDNVVSFFNL